MGSYILNSVEFYANVKKLLDEEKLFISILFIV